MKKLLCILGAVLSLALGLSACSDGESENSPPENPIKSSEILVAYFSCTDTTKAVAEKIAAASGATLYRIVPETPYSSADLNYHNNDCRANREQNDPAARPAIDGESLDMQGYSVVFLGYPIWWGTIPKIIYTFLDTYDLSGKTVIPFCTSGGSGISTSVGTIKQEEPEATVTDGKRFAGSVSQSDIDRWFEEIGFGIQKGTENMQVYLTIGETRLATTLEENAATAALKEKLNDAPISIDMSDYGGWEKVGGFGFDLPASDERITAQPCDFVLYRGDQLVIFYGSNSWSYTRLGKITDVTAAELIDLLGDGDVTVTLTGE